ALIVDIQTQIDTLEQYKRSVITETVTKGLNHNVKMKDSGIPWIGMMPIHWEAKKTKFLFEIVKRKAGREGFDVLSVTQKGLKIKDLTDYSGQIAENYSGYQFVYPTDYVMNHMDLLTGWVDCSKQFGVTSPDYRVFRLLNKDEHDLEYFKYVFQCLYMNKIYYNFGNGVSGLGRWRLQTSTFLNFFLPVPPCEEQRQISGYISDKISKIDSIIDEKRKQLSVLILYKKSLIFEYVTGKKEAPEAVTVVGINPHVPLLAMVVDMLKKPRGEVVDQKLLYLCDVYLGLGLSTQYYRWDYGPFDKQLYSYIDTLVSNGWYKVSIQNKAKVLVKAENHADALKVYGNQFAQNKSDIEKLVQYFGEMRVSEIERFATLFAVWNDFIIDGIPVPSDNQIIDDVLTNWRPTKGRFSRDTWQNTLLKMKRDGIIPKGLGLHTLPKPEGGKSDA
ncbi:MAG: hypothetical protein HFH12_15205, partial [Dorea sp.]|nr:hypothetical protein [Dorea sp.]